MANVRDFGAKGDGKTDDTQAILHAVKNAADGRLTFPRGDYVFSRTVPISLTLQGRFTIEGAGGTARILMTGAGPAFHLIGSHAKSANPAHLTDAVWQKERMPTVRDLEIVGGHALADGIRAEGVMQITLQTLLIRQCRHGIHLPNRCRNVIVSDCHIYNNSGIGVFLDRLNLHQINIHGNHISYNKQGGIVVAGSEIRNIQIVGNDIEYNYDDKAERSHDVFFDCREGTVREGTLVGNTVQAVGSPGGANVRLWGAKDHPNAVGLFAITGNLLGSQTTVLDLQACRGVVVSGNSIYSGYRHALHAENVEHLVVSGNSIDHNPQYPGKSTDQVVFRRCKNVAVQGLIVQHTRPALEAVSASMLLAGCQNVNVTGVQIVHARTRGIAIEGSSQVRVADCTIRGGEDDKAYRAPLSVDGECRQLMITGNMLGQGSDGPFLLPHDMGLASGNMMV
jgi:polygalacturonase